MSQPRVIFMHYLNLAKLRSSFKTNHEHSKDEGIIFVDNVQRKVRT